MSSIRIVAELEIDPGFKEALIPVLRTLVASSRAEAGNALYDLTENTEQPGHFFFIEEWKSQEAIDTHAATPHFQGFVAAIEGKAKKLVITTLKNVF